MATSLGMSSKRTNELRRWWRVRFSLRSLCIFLTLICLYLGCWEITKEWAVDDLMKDPSLHCESPAPYVVVTDEVDYTNYRYMRRSHLCFLGLMAKLPFARECRDHRLLIMTVVPRIIIQEEEEFEGLGYEQP